MGIRIKPPIVYPFVRNAFDRLDLNTLWQWVWQMLTTAVAALWGRQWWRTFCAWQANPLPTFILQENLLNVWIILSKYPPRRMRLWVPCWSALCAIFNQGFHRLIFLLFTLIKHIFVICHLKIEKSLQIRFFLINSKSNICRSGEYFVICYSNHREDWVMVPQREVTNIQGTKWNLGELTKKKQFKNCNK